MYVRLVEGGLFTPLLWRLPIGHRMRMIGPKGKFMLEPGRRSHAPVHLVRHRQRAVRLDDEALPRATGAPRKTVFLNGVSYARDLGYRALVEGWEASASTR